MPPGSNFLNFFVHPRNGNSVFVTEQNLQAQRKIAYMKLSSLKKFKLKQHRKCSCSSAISTSKGKENIRRLQTLSIGNAQSNKKFLVYLTFRMLQHTSSEVNGYNCYKHLKIQNEEGNW